MKVATLLAVGSFMLGASPTPAQNQNTYFLRLDGVCYATNAAGKIRGTHVTERTLLREKAEAANLNDVTGLAVVYHVNGHDLGDTIEIVNASTGQVLDTLFGLYFSQAFARVGVTNSVGTEERRIDYVYTDQDSHSMGAADVRRIYLNVGRSSDTRRVVVQGNMSWVRAVEPAKGGSRMYAAKFRTTGVFKPK